MLKKFQDLRKKNDEMKTMKGPRKRKRRRHKKGMIIRRKFDVPFYDVLYLIQWSSKVFISVCQSAIAKSLWCLLCIQQELKARKLQKQGMKFQ